jgi:hypothetical protein
MYVILMSQAVDKEEKIKERSGGNHILMKEKRAAAGNRTRVTSLGSSCHNRWTTAAPVHRSYDEHLAISASNI